jgi:protein-tyrosine phosphatase
VTVDPAGAPPAGVATGQRLVALHGTLNMRDLGGYPTDDGRSTRWGRAYRSDGLDRLSDADHQVWADLGIAVVCDLRHDDELERAPSRLPDRVRSVRAPIGPTGGEADSAYRDYSERLWSGQLADITVEDMVVIYTTMLEQRAESFGAVFEAMIDDANQPLVFHCTAGKDRTGVTAALLLSALGVADHVVEADYALTDRYRTPVRLAEIEPELSVLGIELDRVLPLFSAQAPVMAGTLAWLRAEHGGAAGYLTERLGLTETDLEALGASLLE